MPARLVIATGLALAALLGTTRVAIATGPDHKQLVTNGERILAGQCARCHAISRTGESPLAAAPPFRQLKSKYPLDHLAEALAEGITTGHSEMPEFVFSTDEIAAILAYIEVIATPADAK